MTASEVIATAIAEVGYLEKKSDANLYEKTANAGSGNCTKYWTDLDKGLQGQPWCNCFVNWCFTKAFGAAAAKKLLCSTSGWSYYTPTSAGYFKAAGQWHTSDPKAGDVIYFKNSQRIHHVGIVEKVSGGTVYTIEGNTSNGTAVIANGGGVCKKSYQLSNASIAGYGRPKYEVEKTAVTPGWKQDSTGWKYQCADGSFHKSTWKAINGHWYYFKADGYIATDWYQIGNEWYYFQPTGDLQGACYHESDKRNGSLEIWNI